MKPATTEAMIVDFITDKIVDGLHVTGYALVERDRKTGKRTVIACTPVYLGRSREALVYLPARDATAALANELFPGRWRFALGGLHGLDLRGMRYA